jgi:hypothetical protein
LAPWKCHCGGLVNSIAYCGDWGDSSISNAASAVIQVSALALILSKTIVSVVENCEISCESSAGAVLVELPCGSVKGTIATRALRSGLFSQAHLLRYCIHGKLSEAASARSTIASAAISS